MMNRLKRTLLFLYFTLSTSMVHTALVPPSAPRLAHLLVNWITLLNMRHFNVRYALVEAHNQCENYQWQYCNTHQEFFELINRGGARSVSNYLAIHPEAIDATDENRNTPLARAIDLGFYEIAHLLLEKYQAHPDGFVTYDYAAVFNTQEQEMLDQIAPGPLRTLMLRDVAPWVAYHKRPLISALAQKNVALIELLLKHGADLHAPINDMGATPLHLTRDQTCAKLLLEHGASPFAADAPDLHVLYVTPAEKVIISGWLPIHYAVWHGDYELVRLYLESGVPAGTKEDTAAYCSSFMIHENDLDGEVRHWQGLTPIELAKFKKDPKVWQLLASH